MITEKKFIDYTCGCKKLVWLRGKKADEIPREEVSVVQQNAALKVAETVKKFLKLRNIYEINSNQELSERMFETEECFLFQKNKYLSGAAIEYQGNLCFPQWLFIKSKKEVDLLLFKSSLESLNGKYEEKDFQKLLYETYVLRSCGINVNSVKIYYLDRNYRKGSRHHFSDIFLSKDLTEKVEEELFTVPMNLKKIQDILNEKECPKSKECSPECFDCACFEKCKHDNKSEDSILWKIGGMRKTTKSVLANSNCLKHEEVLAAARNGAINLNPKQERQVVFDKNNTQEYYFQKNNLIEFMKESFEDKDIFVFFDFESFQYAVPKWDNSAPYEQTPFQWSAHIYWKGSQELKHYEFLAAKGKDPRRACAEKMLELPYGDNVVWIAYNMAFEKGVIGRLANTFPEYKVDLETIRESFVDLWVPFRSHYIYCNDFQGSSSIKKVLPGIFKTSEQLNYKNLSDIQNGSDAQRGYLQMQNTKGLTLKELKHNMLKYCELDTFAMVMIFGWICLVIQQNFIVKKYSDDRVLEAISLIEEIA